jgi:hypothetical protein
VVGDLHKVIPLLIQAYKTKGAGGEAAPATAAADGGAS